MSEIIVARYFRLALLSVFVSVAVQSGRAAVVDGATVQTVTGVFVIKDPLGLLGNDFRVETRAPGETVLFEAPSASEGATWLHPSVDSKIIRIPELQVTSGGSARMWMRFQATTYEAVCDIGPIVNGEVFFRIEPVVRIKEEHLSGKSRESMERAGYPAKPWYTHRLWDIRIAPRPGFPVGNPSIL